MQQFFACRAVEIVYREGRRILHAKTLRGRPFVTSGWKEKRAGASILFDALESVPSDLIERLKSRYRDGKRNRGERKFVFLFSGERPLGIKAAEPALARHVLLLIPGDGAVSGVLALSFARARPFNPISHDFLNRLAATIELSLNHNQSRFELRERVKELTCMYNIANLAVEFGQSPDQFLQQVVEFLPPAYLYPEVTEARIVFDGMSYQTPGFTLRRQSQRADVTILGVRRGFVEVVYREARPELDDGPFLSEEQRLLDSVAREVASIIERKQADIERDRLRDQLRHADRLATIGKLAAGMAHELNEPLTGILGFAELLKEVSGMPAQALKDIGRIESAALHGREVVRKLLLFARQINPRQAMVGINHLVQEVVAFLEGRCLQQDIRVQTVLDDALPDISADASQIRQILMNLMVNAIQAMESGGCMTVATEAAAEEIVISVRDSGPGIPAGIRQKIFLPFFTTKDIREGTGLGLSVVHGIVQSHRGRIQVLSEPDKGAEFRVHLPVKKNHPLPPSDHSKGH